MQPEKTKQQERIERILDIAADLLLRWGYKRVTVDDVAERAKIGKGTIYLHWKTKDALFQTLLLREALAIWRELLKRMRDDAREVRLSRLTRAVMLITMRRPLARALFIGEWSCSASSQAAALTEPYARSRCSPPRSLWSCCAGMACYRRIGSFPSRCMRSRQPSPAFC